MALNKPAPSWQSLMKGSTSDVFEDRKCLDGGYLVGSGEDCGIERSVGNPHEYQIREFNQILGCSKLACINCGVEVVHASDLIRRDDYVKPEKLYWGGKNGPSPEYVKSQERARFYSCLCLSWIEFSYTATNPGEPYDYFDRPLPWQCQGHPASLVTPETGVASVMSLLEGEVGYPTYTNSELILRLWSSASDNTRNAIASIVNAALLTEKRDVVLSRALYVSWPVCGTSLTEVLAQLDPGDSRFNSEDPTRELWNLRDKLNNLTKRIRVTTDDEELFKVAESIAKDIEGR